MNVRIYERDLAMQQVEMVWYICAHWYIPLTRLLVGIPLILLFEFEGAAY